MSRIRKRPVSFGNPALGTYHGNVYTLEDENQCQENDYYHRRKSSSGRANDTLRQRPLVEGAVDVRRLVAMVDVPPEQVPEGILNLARSHRPWIDHVRIVIAENSHTNNSEDAVADEEDHENNRIGGDSDNQQQLQHTATTTPYSIAPAPGTSAMESAASILAAEHENVEGNTAIETTSTKAQQTAVTTKSASSNVLQHQESSFDDMLSDTAAKPSRTYLVLLQLSSEEAADVFVEDLHLQPYTSLDETQVCHVHHVIALQGQDGVSLMSPFFAPARTRQPSIDGGLEILPSNSSSAAAAASEKQQPSEPTASSSSDTGTSAAAMSGGGSATAHNGHHRAPPLSEDYHCAVCLEHMELGVMAPSSTAGDSHRTSILTTVCNHSFHMECLLQWQDSPCPVCRYDHSGLNEALSQCHVCGTTEHNYVCLICGAVSCSGGTAATAAAASASSSSLGLGAASAAGSMGAGGLGTTAAAAAECQPMESIIADPVASQQRMAGSHAQQHYNETLHAYALDTETQHVWDFCGQGYVHRLLQNKDDGKLVEVSDPNNTTSEERSLSPGLTQAQEGEIVHRKLEGFASQYYTLLKSQLEQQRIYYEGRLEEIRREYQGNNNDQTTKKSCQQQRKATDLMMVLKQEHHQKTHRLTTLKNRCAKVREDVSFLRNMNESLESNKTSLQEQIKQAQKERVEVHQMFQDLLPPLQEKVTRLMLQLESQMDNNNNNGGATSSSGHTMKDDAQAAGAVEDDSKPAAR